MSYFFSNNLEIKPKANRKGVFSKIKYNKNDIIYEFVGDRISDLPSDIRYVQVGKSNFIVPSGSFQDYTNHSCAPNSYISISGARVFLIALCEINVGDEICWDYSTSSTEDKSTFNLSCSCGSINCRSEISGFQYLDSNIKNNYINMGIIPDYLVNK